MKSEAIEEPPPIVASYRATRASCQSEFTRARETIPNNPKWSSSSDRRLKSVVLVPSFHQDGTAMERLLHSREGYCSIVPPIIPPYPGFKTRSFSPRTHGTMEQRVFFRMGEAFHWAFHLGGTVERGICRFRSAMAARRIARRWVAARLWILSLYLRPEGHLATPGF